jgi:Domain of unknown function (DUF5063)
MRRVFGRRESHPVAHCGSGDIPEHWRRRDCSVSPSLLAVAEDFERLARAYCAFIDASASYDRVDLVAELERHLLALHAAALLLPYGDPADEDREGLSHEEWSAIYKRLQSQLGDANDYWMVFDPFKEEPPVVSELADDAADIYRNLLDGLVFADTGDVPQAVWEWQHGFASHWGRHAASALYALRVLRDGGGSRWAIK